MITEQIPRQPRKSHYYTLVRKTEPKDKLPPQDFSQINAYEPEDFEGLSKPGVL